MRQFIIVFLCLMAASVPPVHAQSMFWTGETDIADTESLLGRMRNMGATELTAEALACYQAGLDAKAKGRTGDAIALFERASVVDPAFPEAHLALARIHLFQRPDAAAADLTHAVRAAIHSFGAQHLMVTNLVLGALVLLLLGGSLVCLYTLAHLFARVHHVVSELLRRWFPPLLASTAAALALLGPVLWRLGAIPVILMFGGVMWSWMRRSERTWMVVLGGATVLAPVLLWFASPVMLGPLDPDSTPALMHRAMVSARSDGLMASLNRAHGADPRNPDLNFARGTMLKRAGNLPAAVEAYETALEQGGPAAAIRNNLGVIAFLRNDYDGAVQHFREAVAYDPNQGSTHYNLSQAYAKKLYFDKADEELAEANRLSFRRIREMIKNQTGGTNDTLIDEPLPPASYWREAIRLPRVLPGVPRWLAVFFPGSLALLPVVSLPLFLVGLVAGRGLHRALPSFACRNCGTPVCRRCLRRIRRVPYCGRCGDALLQIQSAAYSQLALNSRLKRSNRFAAVAARLVAAILPGYHAAGLGRTGIAAGLCMGTVLGLVLLAKGGLPVTRLAWLESGPGLWWPEVPGFVLFVTVAASWLCVWRLQPSEEDVEDEASDDSQPPLHDTFRETRKPSSARAQAA